MLFARAGLTETALPCPHCQAPLDERSTDRAQDTVTCASCGNVVNLRQLRLGDSVPPRPPKSYREGRAGAGSGVGLLVVVLVVASLGLFFLIANTSVEGTLQGSGELADWKRTPDECVSGQREGFGGVELTFKRSRGYALRVVNDPVKGALLVVVRPGHDNLVLDKTTCSKFDLRTVRGNTNVNDIWAVDGHARFECPVLRGKLEFEGCH